MIIFERGSSYRQIGEIDNVDYDFTFTTITFKDLEYRPEYKPDVTIEERVDNLDNGDTDYILTINEDIDDYYTEGFSGEFRDILDLGHFLENLTLNKMWRNVGYDELEAELF